MLHERATVLYYCTPGLSTAVNSYTNMNNGAELCVFVKGGCSAAVGVLLQSSKSSIVLYIFINMHRKKGCEKINFQFH